MRKGNWFIILATALIIPAVVTGAQAWMVWGACVLVVAATAVSLVAGMIEGRRCE